MTESRDLSRLPVDQTYWDGLEAKIMADLGPLVRAAAEPRPTWFGPLAARAWRLSGLAIAAGVAALILAPPRLAESAAAPTGLLRLPADDPTITAFVAAPAPPALASLVLPRSERHPR
jgi:hypothetical protein